MANWPLWWQIAADQFCIDKLRDCGHRGTESIKWSLKCASCISHIQIIFWEGGLYKVRDSMQSFGGGGARVLTFFEFSTDFRLWQNGQVTIWRPLLWRNSSFMWKFLLIKSNLPNLTTVYRGGGNGLFFAFSTAAAAAQCCGAWADVLVGRSRLFQSGSRSRLSQE